MHIYARDCVCAPASEYVCLWRADMGDSNAMDICVHALACCLLCVALTVDVPSPI